MRETLDALAAHPVIAGCLFFLALWLIDRISDALVALAALAKRK